MIGEGLFEIIQKSSSSPLIVLPACFIAGLLTSFTPCVYPLIPVTAGFIGSRQAKTKWQSFFISFCYRTWFFPPGGFAIFLLVFLFDPNGGTGYREHGWMAQLAAFSVLWWARVRGVGGGVCYCPFFKQEVPKRSTQMRYGTTIRDWRYRWADTIQNSTLRNSRRRNILARFLL